jgi:hypothetical protein
MLSAPRATASRSSSPSTWRKNSGSSSRPWSSRSTHSPSAVRSFTEGRIFPAGTIQGDGANFDPNQRGHIGVWFCRGTHLVAAREIPAAPLWVDTAQLYVLGRQGKEQLATEGVEGSGTVRRIVTGGTGNYAGWTGEQRQTFLGFNSTGGVNLRVTFILRPPAQ